MPPLQLVRHPGAEVDFRDPVASRAWIRKTVGEEILLRGQPHPKVYLLGKDFIETFDLDAMARKDPGAHIGQTFQDLRHRNHVQRCFLVMRLDGVGPDGSKKSLALVFEELDAPKGRRWWLASVEFDTIEDTGLGRVGEWNSMPDDSDNPANIAPFLVDLAMPPPGSRGADVRDASPIVVPDIKFAFGELPPHSGVPTDARQMIEFAAALGVIDELLKGVHQGIVVVRFAGRSWEQFVLTGEMPASLDEMVRWIANHRLPKAEGVAVALIAVRREDNPPVPGMQVIGELGGMFVESWGPIEFEGGPGGAKKVPTVHWWQARPVPEGGKWLGVPSKAPLEEAGPLA